MFPQLHGVPVHFVDSEVDLPRHPITPSQPTPTQNQEKPGCIGLQPSLTRTHYSAGRVSALLQHAATKSVGGAEETFRRVHALLSWGSQTAPICSPVSSHAALAKCQETEYVDRFGHRFRIPVHGPVCENAAPRFGSSEAIDDNAMEQWPY